MVKVTRYRLVAALRERFDNDHYACSVCPRGATDKDIARAYKKLAKEHHPDANPGNKDAEERFKEVSAANDVLGDAAKRKEYDEVRRMVASGVGPAGAGLRARRVRRSGAHAFPIRRRRRRRARRRSPSAGDLFGAWRARQPRRAAHGPQRGHDLETELHSRSTKRCTGVTSAVRFRAEAPCSTCHGTARRRAPSPERCPECHGSGAIAVDQGRSRSRRCAPRVRARPGDLRTRARRVAAAVSRCGRESKGA